MSAWEKFTYTFFRYAPTALAALCFLPSGLIFGYTLASFVIERNQPHSVLEYGPLILAAACGLITAAAMVAVKFFRGRFVLWHTYFLIFASVFNIIASCFYFAGDFDIVGSFVSYVAHSVTFLVGLSYLHIVLGKTTRAVFIAACFSVYLLGIAAAVNLIGSKYGDNQAANAAPTYEQLTEGLYVNFAATYLCISIVILVLQVGLIVLNFLGRVDVQTMISDELRIANANDSIFEKRDDIIAKVNFFYVTKNQQWNITLSLLFTEAIQYALFIYYVFWFALNDAVRLVDIANFDVDFWVIFGGSVVAVVIIVFFSVKVNFVATQITLIVLTIITMIVCGAVQTTVPIWILLVLFGMSVPNLQIAIIEVAHFRFLELVIYVSYLLKLVTTSIVYYYFVSNASNSYFYATDSSTLIAQGFIFIIITALLALVVGMKVPRTYRMSLVDIQYNVLGIIFQKHQIEHLNVKWLNEGEE